jgi:hypothetical protein
MWAEQCQTLFQQVSGSPVLFAAVTENRLVRQCLSQCDSIFHCLVFPWFDGALKRLNCLLEDSLPFLKPAMCLIEPEETTPSFPDVS